MKRCTKCGEEKSDEDFYFIKKHNRLHSHCKSCVKKQATKSYLLKDKDDRREHNYQSRYGISISDYDAMLEKQNYACAICGATSVDHQRTEFFCVDHCHETGVVRGLLCHKCNVSIGCLGDLDGIKKALCYLQSHIEETEAVV